MKVGGLEITDAAVAWFHGYGNNPGLAVHTVTEDHRLGYDEEGEWHDFKLDKHDTLMVKKEGPWVRFHIWRDPPESYVSSRGAMRGKRKLVTGETVIVESGWSSREGVVNILRDELPELMELLPEELVDVSIYSPRFRYTGLGGIYLDISHAKAVVDEFLPGVELRRTVYLDRKLNEVYWYPRPIGDNRDNAKAEPDSELDRRTKLDTKKVWKT